MLTQRRPVQRGDPVGANVELCGGRVRLIANYVSRTIGRGQLLHAHGGVVATCPIMRPITSTRMLRQKGEGRVTKSTPAAPCVTSHTPTSAVTFGISAKYQEMTSRALLASGDVQSRNSSQRTASAVFGTAPACDSRSIAVRCAVCDLPPTASVTNIAS